MVDASVAIAGLLNDGSARRILGEERIHVPHLIDCEIVSVVRRKVRDHEITAEDGWTALDTWNRMGVMRHPAGSLLERMWELRENVSAYDATYVALAEALGGPLVTLDGRLARSPGVRCAITILPG